MKHKAIIILSVCCGLVFGQTSEPRTAGPPSQDVDGSSFGTVMITDSRGQIHKIRVMRVGGLTWFLQDISFNAKNRYTWDEAVKACPPGWRLPNNTEWTILSNSASAEDMRIFSRTASSNWWSASELSGSIASYWYVSGGILRNLGGRTDKSNTFAVRCVR